MKVRDIPWITDGANDFLVNAIATGEIQSVLEFGSGASTLWFAREGVRLVSVEHDKKWYEFIKKELGTLDTLTEYIHKSLPYNDICSRFYANNVKFDLVSVDGRGRVGCVKSSHDLVRPGGYLLLDNDERSKYRETHKILDHWEKKECEQVGPDYTGWIKWKKSHPEHRWVTTIWKKPT
jgi:predicted O-methyltransferase YrrM